MILATIKQNQDNENTPRHGMMMNFDPEKLQVPPHAQTKMLFLSRFDEREWK